MQCASADPERLVNLIANDRATDTPVTEPGGPRLEAISGVAVSTISRRELAKMIDQWPHVMRLATSPRAQQFAFSIWARSGDPRWRPTGRQLRVMRTMLREVASGECGAGTLLEE